MVFYFNGLVMRTDSKFDLFTNIRFTPLDTCPCPNWIVTQEPYNTKPGKASNKTKDFFYYFGKKCICTASLELLFDTIKMHLTVL